MGSTPDSVRPVAEIFTILGEPITKRLVMLSYAVTIPDNAHTDAELITAVERASSGLRPFGLVFRGQGRGALCFCRDPYPRQEPLKDPKIGAESRKFSRGKSRLQKAWLAGTLLLKNFLYQLFITGPKKLRARSRPCLEKFNTVQMSIRSHVPLVQTNLGRLFPYGLEGLEIVSNLEKSKGSSGCDSE